MNNSSRRSVWLALTVSLLPALLRAQIALPDLSTGVNPRAIAVNPVTNRFYIANAGGASVTVIDGGNGGASTVAVGAEPVALAVDPASSRVFAVNRTGNSVTVIDAVTSATTSVNVGAAPQGVAVNPVTHLAYVSNGGDGTLSIIDGTGATTVTVGTSPTAVAVNPQTNRVYVVNSGSSNITVLDVASGNLTNVATGAGPSAIAVNPATNRVYIAAADGSLTVLNDDDQTTTTLPAGGTPIALTVNPATNTIYVANQSPGGGNVSALDGATTAAATVTLGSGNPVGLALDAATNQLYIARDDGMVTVLDGASNDVVSLPAGTSPSAVAVNPITHRALVADAKNAVQAGSVRPFNTTAAVTNTVAVGASPAALAVHAFSGQVFVANQGDGTVSTIDGSTKSAAAFGVGTLPLAVAVNPVTNLVYTVNRTDNSVSVRDLAGASTTTLTVGAAPVALAVNPVTNQIYVANSGDGTLTVIDGASNSLATVSTGAGSTAVAVNSVTNQIYVANGAAATLSVIDGATRTATSLNTVTSPQALAVNPETGRVYVASGDSSSIDVFEGTTHVATVSAGQGTRAIAVNPQSNLVYVTNATNGTVTVIDGATNAPATITVGTNPAALVVNTAANQIYVANRGDGTVSIIDGATRTVSSLLAGPAPCALVVQPSTGEVYVANATGATVTVLAPALAATSELASFVNPLPGHKAAVEPVLLDLTAVSLSGPTTLTVRQIYYQADSLAGRWTAAVPAGGAGQASLSNLLPGIHTLYVFASDGTDATATNTAAGTSTIPGAVAAYSFLSVGGTGTFSFETSSVLARSTDPTVSLVVKRNFTTPATVDYQALNGSATAGQNFEATKGTLTFARNELSKPVTINLINQDLGQSVAYFTVELSNPSGASTIGDPGSEGVFLLNAFSSDLAVSNLNAIATGDAPPADGSLKVNLAPAGAMGQWRLFGSLTWLDSDTTVTGLTSANYLIQFKPVPLYTTPGDQVVTVVAGTAVNPPPITYVASAGANGGSLNVTLAPAGLGGWRLAREADFRAGGTTASNLAAGSYLVEFAPVAGRATPETREALVTESQVSQLTATYFRADAAAGQPPVLASGLSAVDPRRNSAVSFTGQIQTDSGSGSGFVPLDRIVVTTAGVLFDDGTLSFATGVRWLFQHAAGVFEAPPQIPRGTYLLDGYTAQRTSEATPGASSAASQQLDAAALYFLEPSARGGQSGYLASNAALNPWLTSSNGTPPRDRFLAGYPTDGVPAAALGRLHVTPIVTEPLVHLSGSLYTTTALTGFPGVRGGPLFVGYNDPTLGEIFYPAALYLGGTSPTTVRAIDGQIVDLMKRAEVSGNGGANNVGGGYIRVEGGLSGSTLQAFGNVNFVLQPMAVTGAARWGFGAKINRRSGEEALNVPLGSYHVTFNDVTGYTKPAPVDVDVTAGHSVMASGVYVPQPPVITSLGTALALNQNAFTFRVTATPSARSFAIVEGDLPDGLMLHTDTGVIDGSPQVVLEDGKPFPRDFTVKIKATSDQGTGPGSDLKITVALAGTLRVTIVGKGSEAGKLGGTTLQAVTAMLTVVAKPDPKATPKMIFDNWSELDPVTGAAKVVSRDPRYVFEMRDALDLQATFIPTPFPAVAGKYNGLVRGGDLLAGRGSIALTATPAGTFTASLIVGTKKFSLKGAFDSRGAFAGMVDPKHAKIPITLQLGLTDPEQRLTGGLNADVPLSIQAWKAAFSKKDVAPQALGQKKKAYYALVLPHLAAPAPQGDGFGSVTVTPAGAVKIVGTLGDGTKFSGGSTLGARGECPLFAPLYKNAGVLTGLLGIAPPGDSSIQGALDWIKPSGVSAYNPGPFSLTLTARGALTVATPPAGNVQLTLSIAGGALAQTITPFTVTIDTKGKGTGPDARTFSFKLTRSTGLFTGKFTDAAGAPHAFSGALLPSGVPLGLGYFPGLQKQTGSVEFQSPQ